MAWVLGLRSWVLGIGFIQGLDDEDDDREDVWRAMVMMT